MTYTIFETAWGPFCFVSQGGRLLSTYLPADRAGMLRRITQDWPDAEEAAKALPGFQRAVIAHFDGKRSTFGVDTDLSAMSGFQQSVLAACRRIPHGRTASYGDLARAVGKPAAARAVGGVMARNPIPLIIPCHRVLRSDGSIGGFSTPRGISQKRRLLVLENAWPAKGRHDKRVGRTQAA